MTPSTPSPPEGAAKAFGVAPEEFLGGRVRQHWRVRRRGQALVLTRYRESEASIRYELRVLDAVSALGWPVPKALDGPRFMDGEWWTLAPFLPGEPPVGDGELRQRGRLLAEFHSSVAALFPGPRPGFRRVERVLADPAVETTLATVEPRLGEEAAFVRWHLERARARLEGIDLVRRPGSLTHGDFTPWNLRYQDGRLSAILDFELAREDHRVAEFAHAWRGKYDAVVHAYDEVLPLEPEEWAILTPVWWLFLVDLWCGSVRRGTPDDGWVVAKLRERSPLMGPDRDARP